MANHEAINNAPTDTPRVATFMVEDEYQELGDENFEKVYKYIVFADHSDHTGRHFMAWTCFLCPFEETNEFSGHESPRTRRPEDSDALDICWNSAGDKNSLIHLMRESIDPVLEALSSPPRIQTQKIA